MAASHTQTIPGHSFTLLTPYKLSIYNKAKTPYLVSKRQGGFILNFIDMNF